MLSLYIFLNSSDLLIIFDLSSFSSVSLPPPVSIPFFFLAFPEGEIYSLSEAIISSARYGLR